MVAHNPDPGRYEVRFLIIWSNENQDPFLTKSQVFDFSVLCIDMSEAQLSIYEKLDWNKCQELYDTGLTIRDLKPYGYSFSAVTWARRNNKMKVRSRYESIKISNRKGKIDYSVFRTDDFRARMSKYGGCKNNGCGKCKWIQYTNNRGIVCNLQGTWELKFAKFLDSKNVNWERNKIGYKYSYNSKDYSYFPDFVLVDVNIFIEVKGYEIDRDKAKWSQFPFTLLVVKKKEMKDLDKWWNENNLSGNS